MKILLLFLGIVSFKPLHDVPLAVFRLYELQETLRLEVTFDVEDLCKELAIQESALAPELVFAYLANHTEFSFDSKIAHPDFTAMETNGDHLVIHGVFESVPRPYQVLSIENRCLLSIADHSNIMQIELNDELKDFRMHKHRNAIEVRY